MTGSTGFTEEQERFRREVRALLADEPVRAEIKRLRSGDEPEPDVRPLYRELGRRGLLAPNWPLEYGGSGRGLVEAAIAAEELVRAGVPDTLHVNTIQIVGLFILMAGTPRQKATHLPAMARGERFASVLYTEPACGSDLGSLSTTARRGADGDWRLSGVKVFSMKTHFADLALCAARTGAPDSRYDGISLFLVDLHARGVQRTLIRSIADEQFHRVELDDVRVPAGDLLGTENGGWPLLTQSLAVERTGLDYSLKAEQWLAAACEVLAVCPDDVAVEEIGRFGAAVTASRLLTWRVITGLAQDRVDEPAAAMAKLYNSELAQRIAMWAAARLPDCGRAPRAAAILESAYREAPGVTIAGGTSDMMLRIIGPALDRLVDGVTVNTESDPVRRSLRSAVRGRLDEAVGLAAAPAAVDETVWAALRDLGAPAFDAPLAADGLELGLAASTAVADELGRAALSGRYLAVAFAIDATATGGAPADLLRDLAAGDVAVSLAGFDHDHPPVRAKEAGGQLELTGRLSLDIGTGIGTFAAAGAVLVPVELDGDQVAATLLDLSTVDPDTVRLDRGREPSGAVALVTLTGTRCDESSALCTWPHGRVPVGVLGRARIRQAALLLGLSHGALEIGVRYATDRRQFGQPLRDFQSVSFRLAVRYTEVEALRLAVARAIWLADAGQPYGRPATEVLAQAAETAATTVQTVLQVCGVRGMTAELPVHRHYLRVRQEARRLGTPGMLWRELGLDRLRGTQKTSGERLRTDSTFRRR
jgi:alkylation response protein AidB-like acyl-CoA dehydrogenase